jgi:glutamine synthetase
MSMTRDVSSFFNSQSGVKYVRLQRVDFSGVLRTRTVTKARCLQLAAGTNRYALAQNCMIIPISTASAAFTEGPQVRELHSDWPSLTPCGFAPKYASVMCFIEHRAKRSASPNAPDALTHIVESFEKQHTTSLLIGFEIEFVLLNEASELANPLDRIAGYSMTAGLRGSNLFMLEASKTGVHYFHTEIADQLEIVLGPITPVHAIDALMQAQEAIRTICVHHSLKASLTPRPVVNGPHNGCHMHFSMTTATQGTDSFVAGVLHKMIALV